MNWNLLLNSVLVSGATTAAALSLGFVAALFLLGLRPEHRSAFLACALLALALPPFLVTNCWLELLGLTGAWRAWLPFNIYSFGGAIWILTLLLWPLTLFLVLAEWQKIEASQLESDAELSGFNLVRFLLIPAAAPALRLAAVLTFVLALNNFAVPALLQVKVFPAELWVSFNTTFNYRSALLLSWPFLLVPIALLVWLKQKKHHWPRLEHRVPAQLLRRQLGPTWFWPSSILTWTLILLSCGLPLYQLLANSSTWSELPSALAAGQIAARNSILFAAITATLCAGIGLLLWKKRWTSLLWLPFLSPGILLGIGLIFAFNRPALNTFYQSFGIVILALAIRYGVLAWQGAAQAVSHADPDLRDAARLCGATPWPMLKHVLWPQIAPQIAAVWYLVYLFCLWDVETLVFIVPPGGETLALRIFNLLHYGHNSQVNALCLLLLAFAIIPWALWEFSRFLRHRALLVFAALLLLSSSGCNPPQNSGTSIESKLFSRVEIIGSRGVGLGFFNKPRSLAVDANDNLYVVDLTGRVQKFAPDGAYLSSWQMPQTDKGKPKGMCQDASGNIIVIEPHYSRVNHFTPQGRLTNQWGIHGPDQGQLLFPRSAAVTPDGDIFISEYGIVERIQKFDPSGARLLLGFGQAGNGPGQFNRAEGLSVSPAGELFAADSCNHRIQVFSLAGEFLRAFGRAGKKPGEFSYPYDIRIDRHGMQFVCEFGNNRVQVFDRASQFVEFLGGMGAAPGQMNNPWSIALDSHGNLYVADALNHRVQKFIRRPEARLTSRHALPSKQTL